jgi:hypothetical protein
MYALSRERVYNCLPDNNTGNLVTEPLSRNGRYLRFRYNTHFRRYATILSTWTELCEVWIFHWGMHMLKIFLDDQRYQCWVWKQCFRALTRLHYRAQPFRNVLILLIMVDSRSPEKDFSRRTEHLDSFSCFVWGETESPWYVGHCLPYCTSPGWWMMSVEQSVGWILKRETELLGENLP